MMTIDKVHVGLHMVYFMQNKYILSNYFNKSQEAIKMSYRKWRDITSGYINTYKFRRQMKVKVCLLFCMLVKMNLSH
jgi:hypothetical protein